MKTMKYTICMAQYSDYQDVLKEPCKGVAFRVETKTLLSTCCRIKKNKI